MSRSPRPPGAQVRLRRWLLLVAPSLLIVVLSCSRPSPALEERAQALEKQIICPVCPGETLDQSGVQVAKDMRFLIRERLAAGDSEQAIKQYFVDRYGTRILAEPPASGVSLAVWVIPPVAFLAGSAVLYFVVREMRKRRPDASPKSRATAADPSLEPFLGAVDAELQTALDSRSEGEPEKPPTEDRR